MHEQIVPDQAREHDLGRDDLILPVYYVSTPELDDSERRDADKLAWRLTSAFRVSGVASRCGRANICVGSL